MMRGARARSTKQKAHIERFEELKNRERPQEQKVVELSSAGSRMGRTIIELIISAKHIQAIYYFKILLTIF